MQPFLHVEVEPPIGVNVRINQRVRVRRSSGCIRIPNYASAMVTTNEVVDSLSSVQT
jgi:hypothetical protein